MTKEEREQIKDEYKQAAGRDFSEREEYTDDPPSCLETVLYIVVYLAVGLIVGVFVFWLFGAI